jgi:predicted HicB family RNase H-like nuclease
VAITLDLKPEVEAELMAQAQAAGLSLAQFLSRELEAIAPAAPAQVPAALP